MQAPSGILTALEHQAPVLGVETTASPARGQTKLPADFAGHAEATLHSEHDSGTHDVDVAAKGHTFQGLPEVQVATSLAADRGDGCTHRHPQRPERPLPVDALRRRGRRVNPPARVLRTLVDALLPTGRRYR